MANLITDVAQIEDASTEDLLYTYNQLTGGSVKRFSTREVAKRRVEMAMLSAKSADEQTGVSKGAEGEVKTREEIVAKAEERGQEPPPSLEEPVFQPGTMAYELDKAAKAAKPIEPRPKKEKTAPAAERKALFAVQATFKGTSKPQAGSVRNSVLLHIQNAPNSACTIEALDKHFDQNTRGYVQKLLEKNHLVILDEEAYKNAKPVERPTPQAEQQQQPQQQESTAAA